MFPSRVIVRGVFAEIAHLARQTTIRENRPAFVSRVSTVCRTNNASSRRAYATDSADAQEQTPEQTPKKSKVGRPKGSTIANGASPPGGKKPTQKSKPKKKVPTEHEKTLQKVRELKKDALLDQPKGLPANSWLVFFTEKHVGLAGLDKLSKEFAELPQSEKDHLSNIAKANAVANKEAFKTWVESHTVDEIMKANAARRMLQKIRKKATPTEDRKINYVGRTPNVRLIKDIRIPKRKDSSYIAYARERWASGDLDGIVGPAAIRAISDGWKQLSAEEKQAYKDKAPQTIGQVTADV